MKLYSLHNERNLQSRFVELPRWLCPECERCDLLVSHSFLGNDPFFKQLRSLKMNEYLNESHVSPEEMNDHFVAVLECGDRSCGSYVVVAGDVDIYQTHDGYEHAYLPKTMHPATPAFPYKELELPDWMPGELRRAFSTLWCDYRSSSLAVRHIAERIMDHLGAERFDGNRRLGFEARLKSIKNKITADIYKSLDAMRNVGNISAHDISGSLKRSDVPKLFPPLEMLIALVYSQTSDADYARDASEFLRKM